MIIQHAIYFFFFFFSNFYVFYPITEYRCPCKSSAFFSSRSNNFSLSLSLFIFILIWSFFQFRSFSIFSLPFFRVSFRVFFFPSSSLYLKSKREKKKEKKRKKKKTLSRGTCNVIYSINRYLRSVCNYRSLLLLLPLF